MTVPSGVGGVVHETTWAAVSTAEPLALSMAMSMALNRKPLTALRGVLVTLSLTILSQCLCPFASSNILEQTDLLGNGKPWGVRRPGSKSLLYTHSLSSRPSPGLTHFPLGSQPHSPPLMGQMWRDQQCRAYESRGLGSERETAEAPVE